MGLDTVEFVLEIEEEFSISIPDEDAQNLGVLGDLAKYISVKTKGTFTESSIDNSLKKLIYMLEKSYGVPPGKAGSKSHVVHDLGLD